MISSISQAFSFAKKENRPALLTYTLAGDNTKEKFNALYNIFHPKADYYFSPSNSYDIIEDDMLVVDFMTQEQCERLIELADKNGDWESLKYDKFPGLEIRIKEF